MSQHALGCEHCQVKVKPKACLIEEQWVTWEWETDNIQSHAKAPGHGLKSHPTLVWWPGILISGGERFPETCCIQNWNQTVNPIVVWPHARALRSAGNGLRKMGHPPIHKDPQRVKFPWTVVPKIFDTNLNSNSKCKSKTKFCRKHWKTHVFLTGLWFPKKNSGLNALQMQLHVWPDGHIHLHGNPNPYSTYNLLKKDNEASIHALPLHCSNIITSTTNSVQQVATTSPLFWGHPLPCQKPLAAVRWGWLGKVAQTETSSKKLKLNPLAKIKTKILDSGAPGVLLFFLFEPPNPAPDRRPAGDPDLSQNMSSENYRMFTMWMYRIFTMWMYRMFTMLLCGCTKCLLCGWGTTRKKNNGSEKTFMWTGEWCGFIPFAMIPLNHIDLISNSIRSLFPDLFTW